MEKPKFDESAVKIAMDRLAREIALKKGIVPHWYLVGYHEAICDFIWSYTKTGFKSFDWEAYMQEQEAQGGVKRGVIAIKDIKINDNGGLD